MIKSLRIRNLATIEDLSLEFEKGFSIMTGETGAGKSVIIDAVRLILGDKGSPESIRTGKSEAGVEASFEVPPGAARLFDPEAEDGAELLIQRQLSSLGTGKAYINGVLAPARRLKEAAAAIADIYGQNDHAFLLHLENHLLYLDAFLDAEGLRRGVGEAAKRVRSLLQSRRQLESGLKERAQRLDFLAFQIREIEGADLKPGEDEDLAQSRAILKNAEKIGGLLEQALELSYAREESILSLLARFKAALKELVPFYPSLESALQTTDEFGIALREISQVLMSMKDGNSAGPESLEAVEERLNALDKLKRKYGPGIAEILAHLARAKEEERRLIAGGETLEGLDAEIRSALKDYAARASKLSSLRCRRAPELAGSIEKEIALLGMKNATFKVEIGTVAPSLGDPATIGETGIDSVEFLISPNPGEDLRPLRRIASGGEMSRVMLAIKSIGKEAEPSKTLIFDEIDAGIGGRTAECIAAKLRSLSQKHQIICITHLPQIAAAATHHYRVEKTVVRDRTFTTARRLEPEERAGEIARLISGTKITEASLKTAGEMLAGSGGAKPRSRAAG
jgi:DNA repair protein RecN (Recombination protein N)